MMQYKYTFLLPAYKPDFLREALESIKAQTYSDFKVVVSDDCSPHNLVEIYNSVCGNDVRFEYRRNTVNIGAKNLVSHWNLLLNLCQTEYIIMASDDDVYNSKFLGEIDKLVQKYPKVDLFRAMVRSIDTKSVEFERESSSCEYLDSLQFIKRMYGNDFIPCEANYVYRTKVLKERGGFVEFPKAWFSDDATHIMMSQNGCCETDGVLFGFRRSGLSISGKRYVPEVCTAKVRSSIAFYHWMNHYMLRHFEKTNIQKQDIVECYKAKVIRNVQDYVYYCPLVDFLKCLLSCPKSLGMNRFRMFAHWMRNHI